MTTTLTIIGIILLCAAIVLAYRPYLPAALAAYAALWCLRQGGFIALSHSAMIYWGIATAIVIALNMLQPSATRDNRGQAYLCTGIIAGMVLGLVTAAGAGVIIGAICGGVIGAVAYRRTPAGRAVAGNYARAMMAPAFPAIVALAQVGAVLQALITKNMPV